MLKKAYLETDSKTINNLISRGDYPYLTFSTYEDYDIIDIASDTWNKIQYISVDEDGNILGYFSFNPSQTSQKLSGGYFVKFRYKDYYSKESEVICDADFREFIDTCMNNPLFMRLEFMAITNNNANKTYERWMDEYYGERHLLTNYTRLKDGNFYDVYLYWFDRDKREELKTL